MLTFFKILTMIWPFVREMFFGNKNLRQIMKDNKFRVVVLVVLTSSMGLNYFLGHRVVVISREYLSLKEKHAALEGGKKIVTSQGQEVKEKVPKFAPLTEVNAAPVAKKPEVTPIKPRPKRQEPMAKKDISAERYQRLQETLANIKEREEREAQRIEEERP